MVLPPSLEQRFETGRKRLASVKLIQSFSTYTVWLVRLWGEISERGYKGPSDIIGDLLLSIVFIKLLLLNSLEVFFSLSTYY